MAHEEVHEHVDSLGTYLLVFAALMVLLLVTVGAYLIDFNRFGEQWGVLNTALALVIASVKAVLVMLVFMHLRHGTKLTWVIAAAGFVWLCVMIVFSYGDYLSRGLIPESNVNPDLTGTENHPALVQTTDTPATQPAVHADSPGF
jgi:cytochrome c oxidase subunit 4